MLMEISALLLMSTCCLQVGYCILHNGRMCSALEGRYLHMRSRCLRAADMLGALSYEAQAPLKLRPHSLGQDRACESVSAYLQVRSWEARPPHGCLLRPRQAGLAPHWHCFAGCSETPSPGR